MRVASLDLIRGVAVLGILAINVAGFVGPSIATLSPQLAYPADRWDEAAHAFGFLFFEGKMRALFAMLFGASMALFLERAGATGDDGDLLQLRRLGWLLMFGVLHYVLLWWGDILFAYAACGMVLLLFHRAPTGSLATGAVALYVVLSLAGTLAALPLASAEEAVRLGTADPQQGKAVAEYHGFVARAAAGELRQYAGGFAHILAVKLRDHPFWLLEGVRDGFGEFLPLMAIGMALQRSGFFTGQWHRRTMLALGPGGTAAGLAATILALSWLWPRHFPVIAMDMALRHAMALPHLVTALGYAALLVLATPRLAPTWLGQRLIAAGQMAFSNYLGMSVVMTAIFYGWGLGLFCQVGPARQWLFVALGWSLMLGWSAPWLSRFRRGPLEWLWRSLTERRRLPNRR